MQGTIQKSGKCMMGCDISPGYDVFDLLSQVIDALENNMQFPWVDMWGCVLSCLCGEGIWQGEGIWCMWVFN